MHTLGIKFRIQKKRKKKDLIRFKRLKKKLLEENIIFAVPLQLFVKFTSYS